MNYSSYTAKVVSVALSLVGFGLGTEVRAQTTYQFEPTTYDSVITTKLLQQAPTEIILDTNVTGQTSNAPYGLTNLQINNYSSVNPATGVVTYNTDPAAFGLQGLGFGSLTLSGSGNDKLFGTNRGTVSLESGSGTITITGGEGRFVGATGSFNLLQTITSNPDPTGLTTPILSPATISGSFQTPQAVPEPKTDAALVSVSFLGAIFLLSQRRRFAVQIK
ncbi:hypothetical protein NIES4071_44800 [Calothrix sp. NIES-4071]|nr:hypothetical protein NIES4071_44800 [Calothrix sp. NIES-4071]BAZ58793.1 hypothetical protein NIES4105_44730 [Calothrix sp. NIES-4105]